jgi:hypothetical protein
MKKFIIIIFSILLIFFSSNNYSQALSVASFTPALDKKVAKMKTTEEKVEFLQSFSDLLASPRFVQDKNAKLFSDLREYSLNMLRVFEYELKEEQSKNNSKNQTTSNKTTSTTTNKISRSDLPHLYDNFSNIDEQKVRDSVLSWHNEERDSL